MTKYRTQSYANMEIDRLNAEIQRLTGLVKILKYGLADVETDRDELRAALRQIKDELVFAKATTGFVDCADLIATAEEALGEHHE